MSVAGHALGIVLRDQGRTDDAVRELRQARRLAQHSGDPDRVADVRATLGNALAFGGRTRSGLRELDRSWRRLSSPQVRARCLMRRGFVLSVVLGRHREALADLRGALRGARASGDRIWEARTLVAMSLLHLDVGDASRADRALEEARRIFEAEGQDLEALQALHDQGSWPSAGATSPARCGLRRGEQSYRRGWGEVPVEMAQDRCEALLAAGLPDEACAAAGELLARERISRSTGPSCSCSWALQSWHAGMRRRP